MKHASSRARRDDLNAHSTAWGRLSPALSRYQGFTAKHFHEHLVKDRQFAWGYSWTKTFLQSRGLLTKAKRRGAHRRKRERWPLPGMMLHQDGSRHAWLHGLPGLDLIVTMDDAASAIYSAFLVEEEGTASNFRALQEVFGEYGLPLSLYTGRGSHYFLTPEAGGEIGRARLTQVGRALADPRVKPEEASSISRPIRRKRAGVRSGCSRHCRTGWSRS